jgi:LPXTG-motif cell wall-anchored protein
MRLYCRTLLIIVLAALVGVVEPGSNPLAALAQPAARVEVSPASGPPGGGVTLRGTGWPAGALLTARMYQASDVGGPGADLGMAFSADASGAFTFQGVIPRTLFGMGSRGNVEVVPGSYTIVVRPGPEFSASTSFTVVASPPAQAPSTLPRTGVSGAGPGLLLGVGFAAGLLGLLLRRRA